MNILATCYASLLPVVMELLVEMNLIMSWATETFVDKMAEQFVLLLNEYSQ